MTTLAIYQSTLAVNISASLWAFRVKLFPLPFFRRPRVTLHVYWQPLARQGPDYLLFTRCLKFNCEVRRLTKACPKITWRRGAGRELDGDESDIPHTNMSPSSDCKMSSLSCHIFFFFYIYIFGEFFEEYLGTM